MADGRLGNTKGHQRTFTRQRLPIQPHCTSFSMSSPLADVWEAAASSPFSPAVGKNTHFAVGFVLLAICTWTALVRGGALPCVLTTPSSHLDHHLRPEYTPHSPFPHRNLYSCAHRPILRQPARSRHPGFVDIRVRGLQSTQTASADCTQLWRCLHDLRSRCLRLVSYWFIWRWGRLLCVQSME